MDRSTEGISLSPRIANPMIGMGLIQAIYPADLVKLADPDDEDGDGISGRMAWARGSIAVAYHPGPIRLEGSERDYS